MGTTQWFSLLKADAVWCVKWSFLNSNQRNLIRKQGNHPLYHEFNPQARRFHFIINFIVNENLYQRSGFGEIIFKCLDLCISASRQEINEIPTTIPRYRGSGDKCMWSLEAAVLDFPLPYWSQSSINPNGMLDPKNIGVDVGISLIFCLQADIHDFDALVYLGGPFGDAPLLWAINFFLQTQFDMHRI